MSVPAQAKRLLDFIASYEAPRGYDTVYGNKMSRMPRPITAMTVDEVIAQGRWRTDTFGSSACGRYQFMKKTLGDLKVSQRLTGRDLMTPDFQDRLGYALLLGRGYAKFMAGTMSLTDFGNQIAMEWASFPVLSPINRKRRGQSYYAGDGLNHVLVAPEPVERVLNAMRAAPVLTVVDPIAVTSEPAIQAPRASTVPVTDVAAPWWQRMLGIGKTQPVAAKARPGLHPNGSPDLWDVQAAMKDRGYYRKGLLDGLDGRETQAAVAQIRKDNGLGDGGVDAAFLAGLPTWPHASVSAERASMSLGDASKHAPELFGPAKWLVSAGLGSLGLGGAAGTGLMDNVQGGVAKANDVFGQVQSAFALVSGVVAFVVDHKTLFLVGIGAVLVWKGVSALLDAWIKVRQAFF